MFPTMEVRWFYEGTVPPEVLEWFQQGTRKPEEQPRRVDYYLRLTDGDSLGIKLREGRIEIKQRHRQCGVVCLHKRATGVVEHWRKWSFGLAEAYGEPASVAAAAPSWIGVGKRRRLRTYRLTRGKEAVTVSALETIDQGCNLELANIEVHGKADDTGLLVTLFDLYPTLAQLDSQSLPV